MTMPQQTIASLLVGMVADPSQLTDSPVAAITMDSRKVERDTAFFATAKNQQQRQNHIYQAIELGACIVVIDDAMPLTEQVDLPVIVIRQLDTKLSEIASRFYRHPSLGLSIIAVTGTNGKTSVSQFIAQSLESLNKLCGIIGTLGIGTLQDSHNSGMTTPDPFTIQAALAEFYQSGIETVVIEASSHALEQDRLSHVAIDIAVLTNLSRDHLDYHKTMARYAAAKKRLFEFDSIKVAIVNSQDQLGKELLQQAANDESHKTVSYGVETTHAEYIASNCTATTQGLNFILSIENNQARVHSTLLGQFNIANLLATAASLSALAIPFADVVKAITQCQAVNGRMQQYQVADKATVVIDFAHTPDALQEVLASLKAHLENRSALWCVFGCGGDRDTGKRALMGQVAEQLADHCLLTADNPRTEDNAVIVEAILSGMDKPEQAHIEHDRAKAITTAIAHAKANDIVLIAGKGHEDYQEINGVKQPFSDHAVVKMALAANDAELTKRGVQS